MSLKNGEKMLLYLHIPYCDSKCHYCSFNSYVDRFDTRQAYMIALAKQLQFELQRFQVKPQTISSLFIGGGTPSTIPAPLYEPIFEIITPLLTPHAELTAEANPNSATPTWLEGMLALGINRLSFGVQSFDNAKLKTLGRSHSPQQAKDAIQIAHEMGYPHLSLDLIYNLHGDTPALLESDIEEAFSLPIDHLSAYELTIEAQTPFATTPHLRQESDALAFFVAKAITQRGFEQYEVSNFGRCWSRRNRGYWELQDYIGVGAGAVGFLHHTRYYPPTEITHYLHDPLAITQESISPNELLMEKLFLGFRSNVGIKTQLLHGRMQQRATYLLKRGKLIEKNHRYFNPNLFVADELVLYILGEA